ncbi:hypothetical protein Sste5346_006362 [Sporothrix stenoceras]|uniref:Uncharacterized protein n=1 Tax=Sporothrix stenoceras TaxID=5173 RepID=A0ABR3Z0J8_9PEZI
MQKDTLDINQDETFRAYFMSVRIIPLKLAFMDARGSIDWDVNSPETDPELARLLEVLKNKSRIGPLSMPGVKFKMWRTGSSLDF